MVTWDPDPRLMESKGWGCKALGATMASQQFPSNGWVDAWVSLANADADFRASGKGWQGAVRCVVRGSDPSQPTSSFYLEGAEGRWSAAGLEAGSDSLRPVRFTLSAPYDVWREIIRQEADPLRSMIMGRVRVEGQLSGLLRWHRSLLIMTRLAGAIDTEFTGE